MPLYSVQRYVQGIINGLTVPVTSETLTAQVTPPVIQSLKGPVAFVWGGLMRGSRQAGPRGGPGQAGFKRLMWDVDVWVVYMTNPNAPNSDEVFPKLIDEIMAALWSTPMTTFIDPNGIPVASPSPAPAGYTEILSIGENFQLEYDRVHTPATQRGLYYTAQLALEVYESVQA